MPAPLCEPVSIFSPSLSSSFESAFHSSCPISSFLTVLDLDSQSRIAERDERR